jgi:hypothetical protein
MNAVNANEEYNANNPAPAPAPAPAPIARRRPSIYNNNNNAEISELKKVATSGVKQGYQSISPTDLAIIEEYKKNIKYYEKLCDIYEGEEMQMQDTISGFTDDCAKIIRYSQVIFGKENKSIKKADKFTLTTLKNIFSEISNLIKDYDTNLEIIRRKINLIDIILDGNEIQNNLGNVQGNNALNPRLGIRSLMDKLNNQRSNYQNAPIFKESKISKLKSESLALESKLLSVYNSFEDVKQHYQTNLINLNTWKNTHDQLKSYIIEYIDVYYTNKYVDPINNLLTNFGESQVVLDKLTILDKINSQINELEKEYNDYLAIRNEFKNTLVEYNQLKLSNNSPINSNNNIAYLKKMPRGNTNQNNFNFQMIQQIGNNLQELKAYSNEAKGELIRLGKEEAERISQSYINKFTTEMANLQRTIAECIKTSIQGSNFKNAFDEEIKLRSLVNKFVERGYFNGNYNPNTYTEFNINRQKNNLGSSIMSNIPKITRKINSNKALAKGNSIVTEINGNVGNNEQGNQRNIGSVIGSNNGSTTGNHNPNNESNNEQEPAVHQSVHPQAKNLISVNSIKNEWKRYKNSKAILNEPNNKTTSGRLNIFKRLIEQSAPYQSTPGQLTNLITEINTLKATLSQKKINRKRELNAAKAFMGARMNRQASQASQAGQAGQSGRYNY